MKTRITTLMLLLLLCQATTAEPNISGKILVSPTLTYTKTIGAAAISENLGALVADSVTYGTNANQMTVLSAKTWTLTNGEAMTLDLSGGISNNFGDAITFARVNLLAVKSTSTNLEGIVIGDAAVDEFDAWLGGTNHTVLLRPGGLVMAYAPDTNGYAVAGSGRLKFENTGTNTVTFDTYFGGTE